MNNYDQFIYANSDSSDRDSSICVPSSTICGIEVTSASNLVCYFKSALESDTTNVVCDRATLDGGAGKDPRKVIQAIIDDINNNNKDQIILGDDFSKEYVHQDITAVSSIQGPETQVTFAGGTRVSGTFSTLGTSTTLGSTSSHKIRLEGNTVEGDVTVTDKDTQSFTLTAAEFRTGIVVHTSVTGAGVVTFDTAANFISTLNLDENDDVSTCLYINDGNQSVTLNGGTPTGVTYVNNPTIAAEGAATLVIRRTAADAVSVFIV